MYRYTDVQMYRYIPGRKVLYEFNFSLFVDYLRAEVRTPLQNMVIVIKSIISICMLSIGSLIPITGITKQKASITLGLFPKFSPFLVDISSFFYRKVNVFVPILPVFYKSCYLWNL
jgi:hypothetical protein